ncbi:MAG: hypothetical protein Q9M97_09150 [Candidatus Gracilibacteria bacterium]|nr:hypothetical protein [Candidatus Gracilibacteria bacterium]
MKKIIALAIIVGMFGQVSINGFASSNYELENNGMELQYYKKDILEIKGGEKLISKIETFISKIDDNKAKILEGKINKIFDKLAPKKDLSQKEEYIILILNYLELKLEERKLLKIEADKKNVFKNTLSNSDTKKVNDELVKIQNNLLNRGVDSFEQILGELETYTNYEERGNFEAKVNFDGGEIGTSKFELKLKDYIAKSSGFDAQFKSKIEAIIEASPKGQEEVKIKINAFIDYILKDQNYYVLLKDLKITDEKGIEQIKDFIEKAKEIASKNKYIHFEDENATKYLNGLKNLNPSNILKQGKIIASKPLFTAYKKEGNKYYLIPSKYGCDTAKILSNTFDPFNGNTCTDSQYQDLLEDISDSKVEFYIDFSVNNTVIGFEADGVDNMEEFTGDVSFSDKYIEEINFIIKPNQEKYPLEGFSLNYKKK